MNYLLVIAFGVGNLLKFSWFSPDIKMSLLDLAVIIGTLGLSFPNIKYFSRLLTPIFIFFLWGVVTLIMASSTYSTSQILTGGLYLCRWLVYSAFFASILRLIKVTDVRKILNALGIIIVLTGLLQYIFYPDVRSLQIAEWDPHFYRLVGSFLDPGFTGILIVLFLVYLTVNPTHWLVWSASFLAFALTYSRSSYLAFLTSMTYIAWKRKSWKFIVLILLLFTVTVTLLPRAPDGEGVKLERTSSTQARIESWKTAGRIFLKHPIFGVGFNTYRYAQGAGSTTHAGAGSDSSLLFVLATTGIVGFAIYIWYLRQLPLLYLLPLLVHSLFLNSLFYPAVMVWLSLLILSSSDFQTDPKPQS